jgi:hypothetical protein
MVVSSMSDLRERIAAVLIDHPDRPDGTCHLAGEGDGFDTQQEWAEHVADAVIAELHPTRTCALCGRKGTQKFRAYRDGWVCQSIHACNRRKARR